MVSWLLDLLAYKDDSLWLPYGILKKIELACVDDNPRLIILDEPAAGLKTRKPRLHKPLKPSKNNMI